MLSFILLIPFWVNLLYCIDHCVHVISSISDPLLFPTKAGSCTSQCELSKGPAGILLPECMCPELVLSSYTKRTINPKCKRFLLLPETLPRGKKIQSTAKVIEISFQHAIKGICSSSPYPLCYITNITSFETSAS